MFRKDVVHSFCRFLKGQTRTFSCSFATHFQMMLYSPSITGMYPSLIGAEALETPWLDGLLHVFKRGSTNT